MQMVLVGKEEEEEDKKRKEKDKKKDESFHAPELLEKKGSLQTGIMDKELKHGESKPLTQVEHPEVKGILDTGQIYVKREVVVREESVTRLLEDERRGEEKGEGARPDRKTEKERGKELREKQKREREMVEKEARKRAMKDKKDIKEISKELRRKGIITSIRSRMVSRSRRGQKRLKIIKKLLNKIKRRMK